MKKNFSNSCLFGAREELSVSEYDELKVRVKVLHIVGSTSLFSPTTSLRLKLTIS